MKISSKSFLERMISLFVGFFTHHLREKIIAIILAVSTWYGVQMIVSKKIQIADITAKIVAPEGYMLINENANKVSLSISGPEKTIEKYSQKDFSIEHKISLSELPIDGDIVTIQITERDIHIPAGVWIRDISPSTFHIKFDKVATQSKPVRVVSRGSIKSEYTATLTAIPSIVNVTGPEQIIRHIKDVPTSPIVLDGSMTEPFFIGAQPLELVSNYLKSDLNNVEVSVNVELTSNTFTLNSVPVLIMQPQSLQHLQFKADDPLFTNVEIRGNSSVLKLITNTHITQYADFSNVVIKPDVKTYAIPIRCYCTEPSVSIEKFDPKIIHFTLINDLNEKE